MKKIIAFLFLITTITLSCNKKENKNCNLATVNQTTGICSAWGITKDGTTYVADGLPAEFEQEGLKVCVEYELVLSPIACTCCGTKARIISISRY